MALAALTTGWFGCGGPPGLDATFDDPLVEAPARNVDILVFGDGKSCDVVQGATHQSWVNNDSVVKHAKRDYPLNSGDSDILSEVATEGVVTIDVQILDSSGIQIARGCQTVTLSTAPNPVSIKVHSLPQCQALPTRLDVQIVLDTSSAWSLTDLEHAHLQDFTAIMLDPVSVLPGTRWSIVTYGHKVGASAVNEVLPPTEDLDAVREKIASLVDVQSGETRMFDGLYLGTTLSRARAVCGTYSSVVVLSAGPERGSTRRFEDAQIGFFSTPGDSTDDLYLFGIAFTTPGFTDLDAVLPMGGHGTVTGASGRPQWQEAYREARTALVHLVQPVN